MPLILRQMDVDDKLCDALSMEVLHRFYPRERMEKILTHCHAWQKRERQLNMLTMAFFVICMNIWSRLSQGMVFEKMGHHVSLLAGPERVIAFPVASALCGRRQQLGVEPLKELFEQSCGVMTTAQTPGAFALGRRIMAIDGTHVDVPDTAANSQAFGRSRNQYQTGPFPQVRCVQLVECGSHATVDVEISPRNQSEDSSALQLVMRSVSREMLVLHDAGIVSGVLWQQIRHKRAHVIAPIPQKVLSTYCRQLKDGSYLAVFLPEHSSGRKLNKPLLVRVIEYRITDPRLGDPQQLYRLGTTLLNPSQASAEQIIELYHERWEIELVIDEQKTHLRQQKQVLRSKTPEGVRQELYGLFLAHYALRHLMHEAACEQQIDPDRISFTRAVVVLEQAIGDFGLSDPRQHEALYRKMKQELGKHLLPARRLRVNPRVLKKLYRKYKQKKPRSLEPEPEPFRPEDRFLDFVLLN